MANLVEHGYVAKRSIGNAIKDDIDTGTQGTLKFQNAGQTATYATISFNSTCGAVNTTATTGVTVGQLTFTTPLSTTTTAGTATKARFSSSGGAIILNCNVDTTGADINLSSNVFGSGDTLQITSLIYRPPA